jgi:hypothetical protein
MKNSNSYEVRALRKKYELDGSWDIEGHTTSFGPIPRASFSCTREWWICLKERISPGGRRFLVKFRERMESQSLDIISCRSWDVVEQSKTRRAA